MAPTPSQPEFGENIAGRLFDVSRQLQKNRERLFHIQQPTPLVDRVAEGQNVMNALMAKNKNDQEQNAAPAPGALQEKGSQEQGRQRNVGQGKAQGGLR